MPQKPPLNRKATPENNVKQILIGEDDLDDQEFLLEIFSSVDDSFAFIFAPNGSHILNHLSSAPDNELPCLIVLDYNMPELNGAEILKELKSNQRYDAIPKIIWSTSQSDTYREICLALGANDYVIKPSNVNALIEVARHMLSFCGKKEN